MTREEAEKIVGRGLYPGNSKLTFSVAGFVDLLNRLGALKLDEPKTTTQRLYDAVSHTPLTGDIITILDAIDNAGLKLVDK